MKNILNAIFIFSTIGLSAQISVAAKANAIVSTGSASWENLKDATTTAIEQKGKNITGFNVGLSVKIDIPSSFYVMPEVYYSNFKNKVQLTNFSDAKQTTIEARYNRIDVPVLLGYNLLGDKLSAYAGPVGSFNLTKGENYSSFVQKIDSKEFSVGYQLGLQSEISKIIISARYEGAFSKDERKYINIAAGSQQEINYDNRPSLFILGLGYKF